MATRKMQASAPAESGATVRLYGPENTGAVNVPDAQGKVHELKPDQAGAYNVPRALVLKCLAAGLRESREQLRREDRARKARKQAQIQKGR